MNRTTVHRLRFTCLLAAALVLDATMTAQVGGNTREGCWTATKHDVKHNVVQMWRGIEAAPAGATKTYNLKWELPIAAATGVLIASVDVSAANRAKSQQVASATDTASNAVLGAEIATAFVTYGMGCATHQPETRNLGFTALAGLGYGIGTDLVLKVAFNREYPDKWNGHGQFWAGGKSFPSGHAAAAWGLASAFAARNPRHRWMKWSAYAAAASTAMLRFPARKHFPSDILVGGTVGYVTGRWVGGH